MHYAAADGNAAEVSRLLAEGASPNVQDDNGWTPAHFAAQAGSLECMSALLAAGADPALADSYGNTVLWRAVFASKGEGKLTRALRAAGADPRVTNKHGVVAAGSLRTRSQTTMSGQYFRIFRMNLSSSASARRYTQGSQFARRVPDSPNLRFGSPFLPALCIQG
ncbi:MAG: ankyrin repeat domain-containing protein [Haliea sp.]|nr:ankyrin repeat domain-containing protein [Haliea sp.]